MDGYICVCVVIYRSKHRNRMEPDRDKKLNIHLREINTFTNMSCM